MLLLLLPLLLASAVDADRRSAWAAALPMLLQHAHSRSCGNSQKKHDKRLWLTLSSAVTHG